MQIPSSGLPDIASSSGRDIELQTSSSANFLVLVKTPILFVIIPQLAAEVVDADFFLQLITSPHVVVAQAVVEKFFSYMRIVLPLLLQQTKAFEAIISGLKGQANSIRCLDIAVADRLMEKIDQLRVRLNLLIVLRGDLKAAVEQTAA